MAAMMSQNPPTMTSLKLPEESSDAPTDFHKLKEISEKLNLATRRPSVVRWKQIIENRKSNGLYTNDLKPPFLDQMAERIMEDGSCTEATAKVDASKVHRSMLKDTDDTPTKSLSANPFPTVVPTPTRRMRRIAQTTIPEVVVECSPDHDAPRYHVIEEATTERTSQTTSLKRHSDSSLPFTGDATSMDMTSRYMRVNQAFEKIRRDLVIMRIEDNKLARKLLDVRGEMTLLRAQWSCQEHAEMLDDVTFEMEEEEELTGLIKACDLSDGRSSLLLSHFSPLRNIGVSKMNLNRRRFSIR